MPALEIVFTAIDKALVKDYEFTFDYRTDAEHFVEKARAGVSRRFSDFIALEQDIRASNPECFCPAIPIAKQPQPTTLPADIVDQKLKEMFREYLVKLLAHPILMKDVNVQRFLESRGPYAPLASAKSGGVSNFFKNMAKSVTKVKDLDSWYESHRQDLSVFEASLDKNIKGADKVVKAAAGLSLANQELATKFSDAGNTDPNIHLASAFRKFGNSLDKFGAGASAQSEATALHYGQFLDYLKRYCANANEAFENRLAAITEYENAGKLTIKRKQAVDKAKSQGRQDKIDLAIKEFDEAKVAEDNCRDFLKRVGDGIRDTEWPILLLNKDREMRGALLATAQALLAVEKQKLQEIEAASREVNQ